MSEADMKVIEAMETYGGSFVVALAKAFRVADSTNQAKIKNTWDNYWSEYEEMAKDNDRSY